MARRRGLDQGLRRGRELCRCRIIREQEVAVLGLQRHADRKQVDDLVQNGEALPRLVFAGLRLLEQMDEMQAIGARSQRSTDLHLTIIGRRGNRLFARLVETFHALCPKTQSAPG
jgi:hypothetical protein